MAKMSKACCPDLEGSEHFEGRHVGGYHEMVHGMGGRATHQSENETRKGEKGNGSGGHLHAIHYAHIK